MKCPCCGQVVRPACPICKSRDVSVISSKMSAEGMPYRLMRCAVDGLRFVALPDNTTMRRYSRDQDPRSSEIGDNREVKHQRTVPGWLQTGERDT